MSNAELRQAALLISSLEPAEAAGLLAQLDSREVAALTAQLGKHATFSDSQRRALLQQLQAAAASSTSIELESPQTFSSPARLNDVATSDRRKPFAFLRQTSAPHLSAALAVEHPQTIALVLSQLPATDSAQVLARLSAEVAGGVIRRLATILPAAAEVIDDVDRGLERRLARLRRHSPA